MILSRELSFTMAKNVQTEVKGCVGKNADKHLQGHCGIGIIHVIQRVEVKSTGTAVPSRSSLTESEYRHPYWH
jgi:hypothetical protein